MGSLFGKKFFLTLLDSHNQTGTEIAICLFFWAATDKVEFTDWSEVCWMFNSKENVIVWPMRMLQNNHPTLWVWLESKNL